MKTKTGQLLMMQKKSKLNNHNQNVDQSSKKAGLHQHGQMKPKQCRQKQTRIQGSNESRSGIIVTLQGDIYLQQIRELREQNGKLSRQIGALQVELGQLQDKLKQCQRNRQKDCSLNENKQNLQKPQELKIQPNNQNFLKLKQKLQTLQRQNYRLIQNNFFLMVNIKKNLKSYKDSLVRIANRLQDLQFAQASKQIYDTLSNMKNDQGHIQSLKTKFFPKSSDEQLQGKIQRDIPSVSRSPKLRIYPNLLNQTYISQYKRQNYREKNLQANSGRGQVPHDRDALNEISSSSSLISSNKYGSYSQFPNNNINKFFNSEIRQNCYDTTFLDQATTNYKLESEGQKNLKASKQITTIHKCYGNSNDLYKLLLLQASIIQEHF